MGRFWGLWGTGGASVKVPEASPGPWVRQEFHGGAGIHLWGSLVWRKGLWSQGKPVLEPQGERREGTFPGTFHGKDPTAAGGGWGGTRGRDNKWVMNWPQPHFTPPALLGRSREKIQERNQAWLEGRGGGKVLWRFGFISHYPSAICLAINEIHFPQLRPFFAHDQ